TMMMASNIFGRIQNYPLLLYQTALFRRKNGALLYCTMKTTEAQTAAQQKQKPPIKVLPRTQIDKILKDYEAIIAQHSPKPFVAVLKILGLQQILVFAPFAWVCLVLCQFWTQKVIELAVKLGLALNCKFSLNSNFDRKQYFYPVLPKGYQISQFDVPIANGGYIDLDIPVEFGGGHRSFGITRVHMEEDAGKLLHSENGSFACSREIVSEPDMRTGVEAAEYAAEIQRLADYLGVSNGKMQEGGKKVLFELELNAFDVHSNWQCAGALTKPLLYCQSAGLLILKFQGRCFFIAQGQSDQITQETRLCEEGAQKTVTMRKKEGLSDYLYFPEPDLRGVTLTKEYVNSIHDSLPELPEVKHRRYEKMGLSMQMFFS
ncbi:glutamyl-trna(gln) amidotransferase subunit b, partial [Quercus suber]